MARSFATRYEDPNFLAYRDTFNNNARAGFSAGQGVTWDQADTEDRWKEYDRTYSEQPNMFNGQLVHPAVKSAAERGDPAPAPTPEGGSSGSVAGVAIPEPTVSARSAYGSAGNQSAGIATNTGAQSLSGPEAANPSLGKRIYPQHMRALAALAPRVY
ncbi:MAG: hypothetical protein KBH14_14115 [Vicinamibacteria bacterium]|nr:hypothetical protein [Vicinamibacteria bacterium]